MTEQDFVIATGEMHSVREFVEKAFAVVDIKIKCVRVPVCKDMGPHRLCTVQLGGRGR
jgi:GDP-D-mannose dehydratase